MRRKLLCLLITILIAAAVFAACGNGNNAEGLVTKTISVHYPDESFDTTAEALFDGDVPYLPVETFLSLMYRGRDIPEGRDGVTVTRRYDVYTVTTATGKPGYFDVKENTFETANFSLFKNTHFSEKGVEGCISFDNMPYIKVESVTVDREAEPMKIDFDDYGIKIYGDGETVYLPIVTLADMFSCQNLLACSYGGNELYVYYENANESLNQYGAKYYDNLNSAPRTQQIADFNYGEFCLNYDKFLGRPGRSALETAYDLSNGLDAALERDGFSKELKRCLKSTDAAEYIAGMSIFSQLVGDGGHSVFDPMRTTRYRDENGTAKHPEWLTDLAEDIKDAGSAVTAKGFDLSDKICESFTHYKDIYKARAEMLGKPESVVAGKQTYTRVGDTAFIHVDNFMGEIHLQNEWRDYYAGKTDVIPFTDDEGGAVGAIWFGLQQADEDGVKRVIIDLSANTGGSTDEMLYLILILTGHSELYMRDRTTGQYYTAKYRIDRNLDRIFDEKDDTFDLVGDKKISVLSSQNGFSCGGISPVMLHEYGVFVLGENCGGGSCAIYVQSDAYGLMRQTSCPIQLCTPGGVDIDTARLTVCDAPIGTAVDEETGMIDYTAFFDAERLAELIDAHYAK